MSKTENTKEYPGVSEKHPDGVYNGHNLARANMDTVWSVGVNPLDAIAAFCIVRLCEPEVDDAALSHEIFTSMVSFDGGDPAYEWSYRFTCMGVEFKAAGIYVPGGCILTWWKLSTPLNFISYENVLFLMQYCDLCDGFSERLDIPPCPHCGRKFRKGASPVQIERRLLAVHILFAVLLVLLAYNYVSFQ